MPPAAETHAAGAQDAAASKRLKKREIDRRCQREARQRTKSRIAYLEGLVEELRRKDTSGQVASLMKQVSDVRKERDMFARTLRGIEDSIRSHRSLLEGIPSKTEPASSPSQEHNDSSDDTPDRRMTEPNVVPPPGAAGWAPAPETTSPHLHAADATQMHPERSVAVSTAANVRPNHPAWAAPSPAMIPSAPPATGSIVHDHAADCECCKPLSPEEVPKEATVVMQKKDIWRFAHTILNKPPVLPPRVLSWEDEHSDDVPVRAIAEGWPAVEARFGGHLPPLWSKLRRIDEVIFSNVGRVERLAILRVMHWLMRYHADPTSQQAKIPPWYLARPSQNMIHSYALDFFTWPGIRERFMFSQHAYCSNLFWRVHNTNLRLLWQYDFRDCYSVNVYTGAYQLSSAFQERISDINAWTMKSDFFQRWPELYGDIPTFETVTAPMDTIFPPQTIGGAKQDALPAAPVPVVEELEDEESTSPRSRNMNNGVQDTERRSSEGSLYDNSPVMPRAGTLGDPMDEDALGEDDVFLTMPEEGLMPMFPMPLSKVWDVRGSDTIPEHDWMWLTGGLGPGLPEPA